jgi:hypothetical protein
MAACGSLALVTGALGLSGSAGAAGKVEKVETKTSVHHECPDPAACAPERRLGFAVVFNGRVKSKDDDCVAIRKVKLVDLKSKQVLERTVSDVDGTWEIETISGSYSEYRVVVARKRLGDTICLEGRSRKRSIDPPPA